MRYFCPGCGSKYARPDEGIPPEGMSVTCEKCGFNITIKPPRHKRITGTASKVSSKKAKEPPRVSVAEEDTPVPDAAEKQPAEEQPAKEQPIEGHQAEAPATPPAEPKAKKKPKKRPSGTLTGRYLAAIGTGKSGSAPGATSKTAGFRFRDLFYALAVPLDFRKLLVTGAAVFAGSLLFSGLGWLGVKTQSSIGVMIGLILGAVIFWALVILGMGVTSHLADREMEEGKHLPLREGIGYVTGNPLTVLGTPLLFVIGVLAGCVVIAVIALIGRIPYAGPIVYGLTFPISFTAAFVSVLLAILFVLITFSYLPAVQREQLGPWSGAKRAIALIRNNIGRYLLDVLVAAACAYLLLMLLGMVVTVAMGGIGWVGGKAMGADLSSVFLAVPAALFGALVMIMPDAMLMMFQAASGPGWQFSIAGWLVGLTLLAVFSLMLAFVLTYFSAAGVVNYHLLVDGERD